jgi:predicted nuclease of predicted toxin-antitoxin system
MRWLLHGSLTPAVADALRRHGHVAQTLADIGMQPDAAPAEIFAAARKSQLDIFTADPLLAAAPYEQQLGFPRTIVLLLTPGGDVEQDDAVDRLFTRYKRLNPGRLYTITPNRVKIRQLPRT